LALDQRLTQVNDDFGAKLARTEVAHEEALKKALLPHIQRIAGITDEIEALRSDLRAASKQLSEVKSQGRVRDRDIRRFIHDLQSGTIVQREQQSTAPVAPMFPTGIKRESEFDYFVFEERYRGDEADIRLRQKQYLEYFRGREDVVDIGCGRGEFLGLLRENNISARGVELGTDQYLLCLERGLDVVQQDMFSYLESLPDESLGGLFSAQVIEHLTASDQLRFVTLAYQKTKSGSPVVLETINAQCVWAVMRNFFLDPTHVRPVHPETLKFAMESAKFKAVELRFSSPMSELQIPALHLDRQSPQLAEFDRAIKDLNEFLYGCQDYAAIGWR
jgi:SAM-dependent methyltransferase